MMSAAGRKLTPLMNQNAHRCLLEAAFHDAGAFISLQVRDPTHVVAGWEIPAARNAMKA